MRRMNQAYVIATSTKVNVSAVKVDHVNDDYFARTVRRRYASCHCRARHANAPPPANAARVRPRSRHVGEGFDAEGTCSRSLAVGCMRPRPRQPLPLISLAPPCRWNV